MKRFQQLWFFAERGYDAQDNAYRLFCFVKDHHPEINAVYLIDKNSKDFQKIRDKGNCIHFGSCAHYLYYFLADLKISAHIMGGAPDRNLFIRINKYSFLKRLFIHGRVVFLQHGIINADCPWLHADKVNFDLFVTSTHKEYDYVINKLGQSSKEVQLLGLARFDELYQKKEDNKSIKQILLMPTWRHYLKACNEHFFKKSNYYEVLSSFIQNPELQKILEKNNCDLIFYPHYEMQKFLSLFDSSLSRIKLAQASKYDVQNLLIESDVLITDYSSVFFDFAYMKKPMILFQFDEKNYRQGHQPQGYFDPQEDGFGPVVTNQNDVLIELEKILMNHCQIENKYLDRIQNTFAYQDRNNCFRNFDAIQRLL